MIDPAWVSGLAAILFIIGLMGRISARKNAIVVLMCYRIDAKRSQICNSQQLLVHHGAMQPDGFTPCSQLQSQLGEVAIGLAIFLWQCLRTARDDNSRRGINLLK